jgi:acetylornithine deacetylase/succinyl-diaminopimelate desuccinylase-like protein
VSGDDRLAAYLDGVETEQLEQLATFVGFESVSADAAAEAGLRGCVDWLASACGEAGFDEVSVFETSGNPVILAEARSERPDAPTVLVYGHYDVQPASREQGWHSDPFTAEIRDGRVYGRGASDNKAPIVINLSALRACRELDGSPPCTLRYLIEGDEERSAEPLAGFAAEHRERLEADVVHVADAWMHAPGVPAVTVGVRGMVAFDFSVVTGSWNLHSGTYGGAVPNAVSVLAALLASLHDPVTRRVAVPGFYDRVVELQDEERARWARFTPDAAAYLEESGARYLAGEASYSPLEQLWVRPSLEINGAWGGYQGEGIHTIVPGAAHAKLTCRLVPEQDMQETVDQIERHLRGGLPPGAELTVDSTLLGTDPMLMPSDSPAITAAADALESVWPSTAVIGRAGYSVPAAELLAPCAGGNAFLMGFALASERAHGPDEHFHLENFRKGIEATVGFWRRYGRARS